MYQFIVFFLASQIAAVLPAAAPAALAKPLTQIIVAGRWLSLPLPEGYCALDRNDPSQSGFTDSQWRQARGAGRRMLYPFAHCDELKGFRARARQHFAFGSFDAIMQGEAVLTLTADMTTESFIALLLPTLDKFDPGEIEKLSAATMRRSDGPLTHSGLFASTRDAVFIAVFQRIATGPKKSATVSAYGMTGITAVAGVPIVASLMRFDAPSHAVYEDLLASQKAIIASLRAANP